ncbi:MAG: oligosaccharide flippase family protein [Prevotella sp.]|nr:oligosaccharide flippase family protein [Prevotella sp.]
MADREKSSYGHVLKYISIFGGVQGLNILIGLVRNKIVAYLLGPGGMGLVSLFNSTINFVSQTTNLGISFSAVRHVSELFDSGDEARIGHFVKVVRAWSLLTALCGMLLCMVAGPWLSNITFSWGDHTLHFVLLAPAVGLMAITGGETAILKGCRRLKSLAMIQIVNIFVALVLSVPVYYFFGQTGIVPVIVSLAFLSLLTTIWYSYRLYPLSFRGLQGTLGEGLGMVRLGVAFVLAGILGSAVEIVIRSYLNVEGDLDVVGLYNAGYMLTVIYAGMVFSAMETDYFPRLSSVGHDRAVMSDMVNKQIEVSLLLVSPLLALLIVLMPIVVPLLFTRDFLPMVAMAQVAALSMYLKAVSLPISYLQLARANSVGYLLTEAAYDVVTVLLVILGYRYWGLYGTGVAITVSYLFDVLIVYVYARLKYGYTMSYSVLQLVAIQVPLGLVIYGTTLLDSALFRWGFGLLLCFVSGVVSLQILHQKTGLWNALKGKVVSKFGRHG